MPPPPLPDRTETLAPREPGGDPPAPVEPRLAVEVDGADDPERYEQITEHARGGLGRIVRAVDKRLGRTVAVKELLRHTPSNEARFMREALITARLEHPGIVPVHEAGRWPNGDPYYVMKLVEGRTLKELIAERTTMRDRLALLPHVIAVADAVGYAHSEGVIHRDVKPSNIIVGAFGETIVVDWGLARDRKRELPSIELRVEDGEYVSPSGSGPLSTVSGKVVGTPAYMAPEQARGDDVDERADVYAIGAVLYELLAGSPAHQDTTPRATLERVLAGPPRPLVTAAPSVPGELGTIVAKAMARDPAERYANATALAEDLRRYHTGKLVSAHSYSTWALLRKKLSQHRGVVAVAVASAIALGVVGVESFRRVVHERNIARSERLRTEDALSQAEKRRRELVLLQAVTSLRKDPTASLAWLKTYELEGSDRAQVVNVIDEALALGVSHHVFRPGDRVYDAVFTPDGTTLLASVREGELIAYDLATGRSRRLGAGQSAAEVVVLAPDGRHVVTGGKLGEVLSWPLDGGAPETLVPRSDRMVMGIRFSSDGTRMLVEREKGVHDVVIVGAGGVTTGVGPKAALRTAVARDDWSKVAVSMAPNAISAYEGGALRPLAKTERAIASLAVSPRGDLVLAHDGDAVWAVPFAGGPIKKLADYREQLVAFEWAPDLSTVAIVGHAHDILLVDLASGEVRELRGHTDALYSVQWTRDGKRLLSASDDATARIWNIAQGTSMVLRGHDDDVYRARFSPDETQVATASIDGSARVWDVRSQSAKTWFEGDDITRLRLEGDSAVVRTPTTISRWNVMSGEREQLFAWGTEKNLGMGIPSRSGQLLAMPRADWSIELRRRDAAPLVLAGHTGALTSVQFTRDDRYLYTASLDGTLRRWDSTTGAGTVVIQGSDAVRGVAIAADGRIIVQVGDEARMIERDGTMRVLGDGPKWCIALAEFEDIGDRLVLNRCDMSFAVVGSHGVVELTPAFVNRYAVSRDGTLLAGGMADRTVIVWDLRTGEQVVVLRGHTDLVMDVAFSPDGKQLASASYDRTIRVWNLATRQHRVLRGHDSAVDQIAWRDATRLVTGSRDGTIRVWDVPSMEVPSAAALANRIAKATSTRIDVQNRPTTADGSSGSW
ncbi:MAG TPA: protein kinase [Kofleriaceae bacterium]|nr:protein kinase [Kofleriaceae bacterium]